VLQGLTPSDVIASNLPGGLVEDEGGVYGVLLESKSKKR
jgi:hypothetical protein